MKNTVQAALLLLVSFSFVGCYHARVETGLMPSAQVVDIPFATSFIYGLVPPAEVDGAAECPNGVAIVETELSFVNSLVGAITFGIFTPMHIKVTCAAGATGMLDTERDEVLFGQADTSADVQDAVARAADEAVRESKPVYLRFE
ncbi:MAG: Bor family protein [Rhodothermales bacterium]|nr:Bor family protein [Rhodothermales bacterium]